MPHTFLLDSSHCNFTLVGAGYFFIFINVLQFCSGKQLGFIDILWFLWVFLFFKLITQNLRVLTQEGLFPTRLNLSLYSNQCPLPYEVFNSGRWEQALSSFLCRNYVLISLIHWGVFCPQPLEAHACHDCYSTDYCFLLFLSLDKNKNSKITL